MTARGVKFVSEGRVILRRWLAEWFPTRATAREVSRQYRVMQENCPLALADLLSFACMFESTIGATRDETLVNTGKREVGLHLRLMMNLTPEDLRHLQERTDQDEQ